LRDKITFIVAVMAIISALLMIFSTDGVSGRVYDCGMAEWHPDIPPKVKEECRRRALEIWKEQQEKLERSKPYI